jgi:hypothetical protein
VKEATFHIPKYTEYELQNIQWESVCGAWKAHKYAVVLMLQRDYKLHADGIKTVYSPELNKELGTDLIICVTIK